MISRKYNKTRAKPSAWRIILTCIMLTVVATILIDIAIRPGISNATAYQTRIIATNLIAETTYAVLEELEVEYTKLIHIKTDSKERVTAIETDYQAVNRLKSQLTSVITDKLNQLSRKNYKMSLGTIIGNDYLAGRGPDITIRMEPSGYLKSEFISKFSSVGINQTQHQILLNLTVDITTLVPFHSSTSVVSTNLIIAETIIVGEVPEYYTKVTSDDESLLSDINDYTPNINFK